MPGPDDALALDALPHAVYAVDDLGRITSWNAAAARLTGHAPEDVLGRPYQDLLAPADAALAHLDAPVPSPGPAPGDTPEHTARAWLRHRAGHLVPVRMSTAPLLGADGLPSGAVVAFVDDIGRVLLERRLAEAERLALCDPLTNLGNRRALTEAFRRRFADWQRHRRPFGFLVCDLDDFKAVNDTYGHDAGDAVLAVVGRSLEQAVRAGDEAFRLGGDEFGVLTGPLAAEELERLADRLVMVVAAGRYPVGAGVALSVGAAMVRDSDDVAALHRRADRRLLAAKRALGRTSRLPA